MIAFWSGFEKRAAATHAVPVEDQDEGRVGDYAKGVGGLLLAPRARDMALGQIQMYHGTAPANVESIQREGLRPDFGGSERGAAHRHGSKEYKERSRGKVHLTRSKAVAKAFAGYGATGRLPSGLLQATQEGSKGVVSLKLPMDVFDRMERDPDMTMRALDSYPEAAKRLAATTTEHIDPRYFKTQYGRLLKQLPGYIVRHPLRFASGLGATALSAAGLYSAGARLARDIGNNDSSEAAPAVPGSQDVSA